MTEPEWAPLVDTRDTPLTERLAEDDGPIGRAVRRVVASLDDPNGIISAFQSYSSGAE